MQVIRFVSLSFVCLLAACRPFQLPVNQGMEMTEAQMKQLKIGMTQHQVLQVIGRPSLAPVFNQSQWSLVSTHQPAHGKIKIHKLMLDFKGGRLVQINKGR